MDTEYKFNNWTGEEIYPDEEDEYRERVAGIPCFYLKGSGGSETLGADFKELASNGGSSSIPVEDLCALRVRVAVQPGWRELYRECFKECEKGDRPMRTMRDRARELGGDATEKLCEVEKEFDLAVSAALGKLMTAVLEVGTGGRFGKHLSGIVEIHGDAAGASDFPMRNNTGATFKYRILDGQSTQPVEMVDRESGRLYSLYLQFFGKYCPPEHEVKQKGFIGDINFEEEEICFVLTAVYWSKEKLCSLHKAFYC